MKPTDLDGFTPNLNYIHKWRANLQLKLLLEIEALHCT